MTYSWDREIGRTNGYITEKQYYLMKEGRLGYEVVDTVRWTTYGGYQAHGRSFKTLTAAKRYVERVNGVGYTRKSENVTNEFGLLRY